MFTDALAASYYGTPRTTTDIDIIIVAKENNTETLTNTLHEADLNVKEKMLKGEKDTFKVRLGDIRAPCVT